MGLFHPNFHTAILERFPDGYRQGTAVLVRLSIIL